MVVDLKKLSESLRKISPEETLRRDLQRIIRAHKTEIEKALVSNGSYLLRVPDGRQLLIQRPKAEVVAATETAPGLAS